MLSLGLHFGHDANMAIFDGSECLAYYEKERHSRIRHAVGLTGSEILNFLAEQHIRLEDIDVCSITITQDLPIYDWEGNIYFDFLDPKRTHFNKIANFLHLYSTLGEIQKRRLAWAKAPPKEVYGVSPVFPFEPLNSTTPRSLGDIADRATMANIREYQFQDVIFSIDGRRPKRSLYMCHHLAHAQYAYSSSPYANALIISFDGMTAPNFSGGGIYFGYQGVCYSAVPHGFWGGTFYERVSQTLGLGADGAGKLMGLAGYGIPVYADRRLVGSITELPGSFAHGSDVAMHWLKDVVHAESLPDWDCWSFPPEKQANIAASAQWIFQENVLATVDAAVKFAARNGLPYDGICLTGGCALNCPANSLVASKYENVFVPPAVNDEGLSLGAALSFAPALKTPRQSTPSLAYKGGEYPSESAAAAEIHGSELKVLARGDEALSRLAQALCQGSVAGFYYGASEIGPRALGHRSILASAEIHGNRDRVNRIKDRELWRPFAPVITERSLKYFSHVVPGSYFMLFNARVRDKGFPAVTHADGSTRPQLVTPDCGDIFTLLGKVGRISGIEVLLNTSFNGRGEPIVERPSDAVAAFLKMDLDLLYLNGTLFGK